jgi:hypothetical protein
MNATTGTVFATLRALARIFRSGLLWWGGAIAGGFLTVGFAIGRWGQPDRSIWTYSGTWVRWVLLVIGILVVPLMFRVLVAHGITRRGFAAASAAGIGLLAAITGCYMVIGYLVERAFYAAGDHPTTLMQPHLFDSTGQVHLIFAEYALLAGASLVTGWLVGVGYLRLGWFFGTLALPLTAIPVAAVEYLLGTWPSAGWNLGQLDVAAPGLPLGVALPLAAAAVGLGLLAGRWLLHAVPIKPKTS